MGWNAVAGGFCIIVGLSLVAGFLSQFRERGYVGLLGFSFLALAVAAFQSEINENARNYALIFAGILFILSFISAVQQTRQRLTEIRRRQEAFEEQMLAMLEVERQRYADEKEKSEEPSE
jgi:ABC-type Fe3+ transport system permease subunit